MSVVRLVSEAPSSWDAATSTLQAVWYAGSPVARMGGFVLVFDWEGCDLTELNRSAPLFDSHGPFDLERPGFPITVANQHGVVVPGSAVIEGSGDKRRGVCTVQIARIPETASLVAKIEQGIAPKFSMGVRLRSYELITGTDRAKRALEHHRLTVEDEFDVYLVTDWQPYELSMVTIPADPLAVALSDHPMTIKKNNGQPGGTAPASSETPAAPPAPAVPAATLAAAQDQGTPPQTPPPAPPPAAGAARAALLEQFGFTPIDLEAALGAEALAQVATLAAAGPDHVRRAELYRAQQIQAAAQSLGLADDQWKPLVETFTPLTEARRTLLTAGRKAQPHVSNQTTLQADERDKVRLGVESVLLHRLGLAPKVEGFGLDLRGMRFAQLARELLSREGIRVGHAPTDIWAAAHDSSDLPKLMAGVVNKTLLRAYEAAERTWMGLSRPGDAQDFKPQRRLRIDSINPFKKLPRGGEIEFGKLAESEEVYALATFAQGITFTRQMFVDDDLSALSRLPQLIGIEAAELESDVVWALLLQNVVLSDGNQLFSVAHGNTGTAVLGVTGLSTARAAMRVQKRLDGKTPLNINPKRLFVPAALETTAQQLTTSLQAQQAGNVNPFQGAFDMVKVEPRLDVASLTAWYLSANPDAFDVLEHAWLGGSSGPMVEERASWTRDGMEFRALMDFGAGVLDHRGLYRRTGAG